MKVSVLGCNSFVGKHLIAELANRKNIELSVFGRKPNVALAHKINCIEGDFEDADALFKAVENQDVIYHLISQTIPATTWNEPLLDIEKNLIPTLNLIELAAKANVKKICFASSGGTVYGLQQNHLSETSLTEPFSPHGIIKRTIESFLQYARLRHNLNYDIYRISNVYGEGQNVGKGLGFINTALENIVNNRPVVVYGDGENVRDYIYVKDAAKLLCLSIEKDFSDSDIYNVSSNHSVSLNEIIQLIRKTTDVDFDVEYVSNRSSDNSKVLLDNTKIMRFFGSMRLTTLAEGIKTTFQSLRENSTLDQINSSNSSIKSSAG